MSFLLMCAAYFAAVLVSTVILIRLRPEWLLDKSVAPKDGDELDGLTSQEREDYRRMCEYRNLYPAMPKAVLELAKHRRGQPDTAVYRLVHDGGAVVAVLGSPLALLLGLPASICIRGAVNSVNTSERTRAAIEKELTAARKEIDDLLRGDAHAQ